MKLTIAKQRKDDFRVVDLRSNKMTVWLSKSACLTIEPGDSLQIVSRAAGEHWQGVSKSQARQLAAYLFALGERSCRNEHGLPWRKAELSVDPKRRYLR